MHIARRVWTYGLTEEIVAAVEEAVASSSRNIVVAPFDGESGVERSVEEPQVGCVVARLNPEARDPAELLKDLAKRRSSLSVVYVVEQPTAKAIVGVMRQGASDVVEWPTECARLDNALAQALDASLKKVRRLTELQTARRQLEVLTPAELEVLKLMLDGKVNKNIAGRLGVALRTVEARRKRIFDKLGTRSLPEIAGALNRVGLLGRAAPAAAPPDADD